MSNKMACTWQIVHIPSKPTIPHNQQPTVDVVASVIEPKHASTLVRRLNQIAPFENLRHAKRIQKKHLDGGKTQLSVILCLASEDDNQLNSLLQDVQELSNSYQLSPFITKVYKYAATSKEEWEEQCQLWPTSYHPPTFNIDGITGFGEEDSKSIFSFMNVAIELAKSGDGSMVNAAVIVDPSVHQIITSGCDQIFSWDALTNMHVIRNDCYKQSRAHSSDESDGVVSCITAVLPNTSPIKPERLSYGASCLNPWKWSEQQLDTANCCFWHPLQHAAIVAIESSTDRDRRLYPGFGDAEDGSFETKQPYCVDSPAKRHKTNLSNVEVKESDPTTAYLNAASDRPYLCTGYDICLVWEPCVMCAMALVHQRIRRIFYAFPNPNAGALGSVHRLQGERSLNHHYAVFRVCVPEEVIDKCSSKSC